MVRRGGGPGGGSRAPQSRETNISKKISWILRHGAEKEGLKLDANGYASCSELLSWSTLRSLKVTFPELRSIVISNDKQRYSLIHLPSLPADPIYDHSSFTFDLDDPSLYLIRANQGHSIAIESENLLQEIKSSDPDFPEEVVHGTFPAAWDLILKSGGLKKMERTHVHFAHAVPDVPAVLGSNGKDAAGSESERVKEEGGKEDKKVISGMRKGASVLIWVDVRRSSEMGGLKWWKSANGVILTEGDREGKVDLEWVKRVVRRRTGEVIWENRFGRIKGE